MANHWANMSPERRADSIKKRLETRRRNRQAAEELSRVPESLRLQINAMKRELDALEKHSLANKVSQSLTGKALLRDSEIAAMALPKDEFSLCGVYFLVADGRVVYVGQSVNVSSRLIGHGEKKFTHVAFIRCRQEELDRIESLYIHLLRPPLNGSVNDVMVAPLALDRLISMA